MKQPFRPFVMHAPAQPCPGCGAEVLHADLLQRAAHGLADRVLHADPEPVALDGDDVLLCVGWSNASDRQVLLPLTDPAAVGLRRTAAEQGWGHQHGHRPHVCALVPADWTTAGREVAA